MKSFSNASGLHLNFVKCEWWSIQMSKHIQSIPVKDAVTYLGISLTKDINSRPKQHFSLRMKTKMSWICGFKEIFLLLAGSSWPKWRYLKGSLSCSIFICSWFQRINNLRVHFGWKNRPHFLQKEQLYAPKAKEVMNYECLRFKPYISNSLDSKVSPTLKFYLVLHSIQCFHKIGALQFLFKCH